MTDLENCRHYGQLTLHPITHNPFALYWPNGSLVFQQAPEPSVTLTGEPATIEEVVSALSQVGAPAWLVGVIMVVIAVEAKRAATVKESLTHRSSSGDSVSPVAGRE